MLSILFSVSSLAYWLWMHYNSKPNVTINCTVTVLFDYMPGIFISTLASLIQRLLNGGNF